MMPVRLSRARTTDHSGFSLPPVRSVPPQAGPPGFSPLERNMEVTNSTLQWPYVSRLVVNKASMITLKTLTGIPQRVTENCRMVLVSTPLNSAMQHKEREIKMNHMQDGKFRQQQGYAQKAFC